MGNCMHGRGMCVCVQHLQGGTVHHPDGAVPLSSTLGCSPRPLSTANPTLGLSCRLGANICLQSYGAAQGDPDLPSAAVPKAGGCGRVGLSAPPVLPAQPPQRRVRRATPTVVRTAVPQPSRHTRGAEVQPQPQPSCVPAPCTASPSHSQPLAHQPPAPSTPTPAHEGLCMRAIKPQHTNTRAQHVCTLSTLLHMPCTESPLELNPHPVAQVVLPHWAPGGGCWRETALARLCQTLGGRCAAGVSLAGARNTARNTASAGSSGVPLCSQRQTQTLVWGCRRPPSEGHPWVQPDPTPRLRDRFGVRSPPHTRGSRCSRGLGPSVGPHSCGARRGAVALQPQCGARRRPGEPGRELPEQGRDPGIKNIPGTDFEPDKITSAARNVSPHPPGRPAASSPPQPHTAPSPTPLPARPHSAHPNRLQPPSTPHVSQGPFTLVCTQNTRPTCMFVRATHATGMHVCARRGATLQAAMDAWLCHNHMRVQAALHTRVLCVHRGSKQWAVCTPPPGSLCCLALFHSRRSSAACRGGDITGDAQPGAQRPAPSQGMATHLLRIGRPVPVLGWSLGCSCHPRSHNAVLGTHTGRTGSPGLAACPCTAARSTALCPPRPSS